ncbi:hypothetical protein MNV49_006569 [Pseudohyphozyma bogoriensis]|nr:hypothetical protein MNV49_006569 [Pseudohyphozyma bogoriensis]
MPVPIPLPPSYRLDSSPSGLATEYAREIFDALMADEVYWGKYRPFGMIKRQIERAWRMPVIVKENEDGTEELAAFARVVADGEDFAYLDDVCVLPKHQKLGLAKAVVRDAIFNSGKEGDESSEYWQWVLWTDDAQKLYAGVDFVPAQVPRAMERLRPNRPQVFDP